MNESEVLKIEDVLPHIMGSIKIEVFKKEITNCINKYENNIQELKKDISKYNKTAEDIKSDIYKVKKKQMEIKYKQCICEICNNTIKDDNIFLFPCGHLFDSNCIIEALIKYSSFIVGINQKMEKIHIMKGDIVLLEKRRTASKINFDGDDNTDRGTFFSNFMNFGFNENKQNNRNNLSISSGELSKLNELRVIVC
jgi:predicted RNase H-like nuclease (RuvC/YqgF family)